eukprot:scaffold2200_cov413-Prasinococcus_capsulatus_cf.AAC.27
MPRMNAGDCPQTATDRVPRNPPIDEAVEDDLVSDAVPAHPKEAQTSNVALERTGRLPSSPSTDAGEAGSNSMRAQHALVFVASADARVARIVMSVIRVCIGSFGVLLAFRLERPANDTSFASEPNRIVILHNNANIIFDTGGWFPVVIPWLVMGIVGLAVLARLITVGLDKGKGWRCAGGIASLCGYSYGLIFGNFVTLSVACLSATFLSNSPRPYDAYAIVTISPVFLFALAVSMVITHRRLRVRQRNGYNLSLLTFVAGLTIAQALLVVKLGKGIMNDASWTLVVGVPHVILIFFLIAVSITYLRKYERQIQEDIEHRLCSSQQSKFEHILQDEEPTNSIGGAAAKSDTINQKGLGANNPDGSMLSYQSNATDPREIDQAMPNTSVVDAPKSLGKPERSDGSAGAVEDMAGQKKAQSLTASEGSDRSLHRISTLQLAAKLGVKESQLCVRIQTSAGISQCPQTSGKEDVPRMSLDLLNISIDLWLLAAFTLTACLRIDQRLTLSGWGICFPLIAIGLVELFQRAMEGWIYLVQSADKLILYSLVVPIGLRKEMSAFASGEVFSSVPDGSGSNAPNTHMYCSSRIAVGIRQCASRGHMVGANDPASTHRVASNGDGGETASEGAAHRMLHMTIDKIQQGRLAVTPSGIVYLREELMYRLCRCTARVSASLGALLTLLKLEGHLDSWTWLAVFVPFYVIAFTNMLSSVPFFATTRHHGLIASLKYAYGRSGIAYVAFLGSPGVLVFMVMLALQLDGHLHLKIPLLFLPLYAQLGVVSLSCVYVHILDSTKNNVALQVGLTSFTCIFVMFSVLLKLQARSDHKWVFTMVLPTVLFLTGSGIMFVQAKRAYRSRIPPHQKRAYFFPAMLSVCGSVDLFCGAVALINAGIYLDGYFGPQLGSEVVFIPLLLSGLHESLLAMVDMVYVIWQKLGIAQDMELCELKVAPGVYQSEEVQTSALRSIHRILVGIATLLLVLKMEGLSDISWHVVMSPMYATGCVGFATYLVYFSCTSKARGSLEALQASCNRSGLVYSLVLGNPFMLAFYVCLASVLSGEVGDKSMAILVIPVLLGLLVSFAVCFFASIAGERWWAKYAMVHHVVPLVALFLVALKLHGDTLGAPWAYTVLPVGLVSVAMIGGASLRRVAHYCRKSILNASNGQDAFPGMLFLYLLFDLQIFAAQIALATTYADGFLETSIWVVASPLLILGSSEGARMLLLGIARSILISPKLSNALKLKPLRHHAVGQQQEEFLLRALRSCIRLNLGICATLLAVKLDYGSEWLNMSWWAVFTPIFLNGGFFIIVAIVYTHSSILQGFYNTWYSFIDRSGVIYVFAFGNPGLVTSAALLAKRLESQSDQQDSEESEDVYSIPLIFSPLLVWIYTVFFVFYIGDRLSELRRSTFRKHSVRKPQGRKAYFGVLFLFICTAVLSVLLKLQQPAVRRNVDWSYLLPLPMVALLMVLGSAHIELQRRNCRQPGPRRHSSSSSMSLYVSIDGWMALASLCLASTWLDGYLEAGAGVALVPIIVIGVTAAAEAVADTVGLALMRGLTNTAKARMALTSLAAFDNSLADEEPESRLGRMVARSLTTAYCVVAALKMDANPTFSIDPFPWIGVFALPFMVSGLWILTIPTVALTARTTGSLLVTCEYYFHRSGLTYLTGLGNPGILLLMIGLYARIRGEPSLGALGNELERGVYVLLIPPLALAMAVAIMALYAWSIGGRSWSRHSFLLLLCVVASLAFMVLEFSGKGSLHRSSRP